MTRYVTTDELEAAIAGTIRGVAQGMREREAACNIPAVRTLKRLSFPARIAKFAANGKRMIRGVASTGAVDLQRDIVVPSGGTWRLPLPLLHQHDHAAAIGAVRAAKATAAGIEIEAEVAEGIPRADEIWKLVGMLALDALSIGFLPDPSATEVLPSGGLKFKKWTLTEVSIVAVGANPEARFTVRAAGSIKLIQPGVKLIGG